MAAMESIQLTEKSKDELCVLVQNLQQQLLDEKKRTAGLTEDLRLARQATCNTQLEAEREEEAITIKLMKRLEQLKREKAALATEVEQEEEFLTNTLQKRLTKLDSEKQSLETQLHDLKKQMEQLASEKQKLCKEKIDLEAVLESESEYIVNKLQVQLEKLGVEKKSLQREKSELQRQVSDLASSVDKLNKDKVKLEQEMEMEEENIVNKLQRQLEVLLHNFRVVENKLEAKGLSFKQLGIGSGELMASDAIRVYSRSPSSASSFDGRFGGPFGSPYSSATMGTSPPALGAWGASMGPRRERSLSSSAGGQIPSSAPTSGTITAAQ